MLLITDVTFMCTVHLPFLKETNPSSMEDVSTDAFCKDPGHCLKDGHTILLLQQLRLN